MLLFASRSYGYKILGVRHRQTADLQTLLSTEIRNSYTTNKLRNRTTTYSNEQEGMLLSSAFKAKA